MSSVNRLSNKHAENNGTEDHERNNKEERTEILKHGVESRHSRRCNISINSYSIIPTGQSVLTIFNMFAGFWKLVNKGFTELVKSVSIRWELVTNLKSRREFIRINPKRNDS